MKTGFEALQCLKSGVLGASKLVSTRTLSLKNYYRRQGNLPFGTTLLWTLRLVIFGVECVETRGAGGIAGGGIVAEIAGDTALPRGPCD